MSQEVWLDEITEGLFDDVASASEDSGSEDEVLPKRPIRAEDRKTLKQRQKERRVKEEVKCVFQCVCVTVCVCVLKSDK